MKKQIIKNKTFDEERALYNSNNITIEKCLFSGPKDGESALKESNDIIINNSTFNLRYPLWHDTNIKINDSILTLNARAALWYDDGIKIQSCKLKGIKALRESKNVIIKKSEITSNEFGWRNNNITIIDTKIDKSEYLLFETKNIIIKNVQMQGKYSFQYTKDVVIDNSKFDTKDAFWHAKNVTVKNSIIKGEYLGWYSNGLTLINCTIEGTQPLCYCKNLKLINCKMIKTDLAFEYSDVEAKIDSNILSIKNPKSGHIKANKINEIILSDSKIKTSCKIETNK